VICCVARIIFGMLLTITSVTASAAKMNAPLGLSSEQIQALSSAVQKRPSLEALSLPFQALSVQDSSVLMGPAEFWPSFLNDVQTAQEPIFIQVYGWTPDVFTEEIVQLLGKKVKAGVPVYLLLDAEGARALFPGGRGDKLKEKAQQLGIVIQTTLDLQRTGPHFDHRKIYVVGQYAYITGYTFEEQMFASKFDVALRVRGGALRNQLLWAFWMSWIYLGNNPAVTSAEIEDSWSNDVSSPNPLRAAFGDNPDWTLIQNIPGGERRITESLKIALAEANEPIVLINPYFGDTEIWKLVLAARARGVPVTLVTPEVPERKIYAKQFKADAIALIDAGVEVRFYSGRYGLGRLHAKVVLIGNKFVQVGSTNLDPFSLRRNYEIALQSRNTKWNQMFRAQINTEVIAFSSAWSGPVNTWEERRIRRGALCSGLVRFALEQSNSF
jgi:cardiolipin synthase A/B